MALNQTKGNMYSFVTHTFNIIKGKCSHDCIYCYMKRFPQKNTRLDEKELKTDLGSNRFIFVGSSTDMFSDDIPDEWIKSVLEYCRKFDNKYLFQSKNPKRLFKMHKFLPSNVVLGTTIETNRHYLEMGKVPNVRERSKWMQKLSGLGFDTMVTIEPIIDFDIDELVELVRQCNPKWVNIGADSRRCDLPEPDSEKINALISSLKNHTDVKQKKNIKRLI